MSLMKNRNFKNYFIDPKYQFKFIFLLLGTNLLIAGILLSATYLFFVKSPTVFGLLEYMKNDSSIHFRQELEQFLFILAGCSVVFILLIGAVAVVLSHRSAGPIYRFKKVFEDIEAGKLSERVHIRPHDDFQEVAETFNKMMDKITKVDSR